MKRFYLFVGLFLILLLVSCAGMPKLFQPQEPYCTVEEQETSLIYKYLNPADAKFILVSGLAFHLNSHPENASAIKRNLLALKASVGESITYAALDKFVAANFGIFAGVVLSEAFANFKEINLPLSVCDKRMTLGATNRLLDIVAMVQTE